MEKEVPNVNFLLKYVETMSGRSSDDPYLKEHLEERRFYSSVNDDDYIKYVNKGSKEVIDYVEYSGNSEKSHGIFDKEGLMTNERIKELRNQLRGTKSVIWHGVISFTEDFGNTYCDTTEKSHKLLVKTLPKFFENANLDPENIVWYAGLHENTDNKHIHISFFEKEPLRYKRNKEEKQFSNGKLPLNSINKFKISVELSLLQVNENIFSSRKTLTSTMKRNLSLGEYMKQMNTLMIIVPNEHRISYDSENMKKYKNQIDMVINAIIRADKDLFKKFCDFDDFLLKRDNEIKNAYTRINLDYSDKLLHDKCIEDIYKRLGNIILYTIKDIRMQQKKEEFETNRRLALKRIEKNKRKILLNKCKYLNNLVNQEIVKAFEEYRYKLEEASYKRLKEQGILE